jgi:RND family efflux transporter MFP subunit
MLPSKRFQIGAVLITVFVVLTYWVMQTEPPKKKPKAKPVTPSVTAIKNEAGTHALELLAYGSVMPAELITLEAQAKGQLIALHRDFEPGGQIARGETLYSIDDREYQLNVDAANAALKKAQADIAMEAAQRKVAEKDLEILSKRMQLSDESKQLALRLPQQRQAEAELASAQRQLKQAQLDLSHTQRQIETNVVVVERKKVIGDTVSIGDEIGSVARADRYWVELRLPTDRIAKIKPRTNSKGSQVKLKANDIDYQGELIRIHPQIDSDSRLAKVIVEINQPLTQSSRPLLLGTYVEAKIMQHPISNAVKLPREAVTSDSRVWGVDSNKLLQITPVTLVDIDNAHAYIEAPAGLTHLLTKLPGSLSPGTIVSVKTTP